MSTFKNINLPSQCPKCRSVNIIVQIDRGQAPFYKLKCNNCPAFILGR